MTDIFLEIVGGWCEHFDPLRIKITPYGVLPYMKNGTFVKHWYKNQCYYLVDALSMSQQS